MKEIPKFRCTLTSISKSIIFYNILKDERNTQVLTLIYFEKNLIFIF